MVDENNIKMIEGQFTTVEILIPGNFWDLGKNKLQNHKKKSRKLKTVGPGITPEKINVWQWKWNLKY